MFTQQIPWEYPVTTIYSYTENNPPVIPNVIVEPSLAPYIPLVTAIVANVAGQYAQTSPVRMYCYNTLAANNWNNHAVPAVVKLVCDLITVKQQRGEIYSFDISVLESIAEEVLTCYASALAYNNNQLMQQLPPTLAQAVSNNYRSYNDMIAMTSSGPRQPMQGMHGRPSVPGMRGTLPPPAHPALGQGQRGFEVTGNKFAQGPSTRPISVTGQHVSSAVVAGMNRQKQVIQEAPAAPSRPAAAPATIQPKQAQSAPTKATDNTVGVTYMDRDLHRIAYHDQWFPNAISPKQSVASTMEKAITLFPELNPSDVEDYDLVYACDLEAAISDIHAHHSPEITTDIKISAHFVNVTHPIIAPVEIKTIFDKFKEIFVFDGLAKLIRSTIMMGTPDDAVSRKKQLVWAGQVDRVMTQLLNDWLLNAFAEHSDKMDSFIEDAGELAGYIVKNYGNEAMAEYLTLQRNVMACISDNIRRSDGTDIDVLADGHVSRMLADGAVDVNQITIPHVVYYISELAETLDYCPGKTPVAIVEEEMPQLFKLLKALHANARSRKAVKSIILTADNYRYEFYRSATSPLVFYIVEV